MVNKLEDLLEYLKQRSAYYQGREQELKLVKAQGFFKKRFESNVQDELLLLERTINELENIKYKLEKIIGG